MSWNFAFASQPFHRYRGAAQKGSGLLCRNKCFVVRLTHPSHLSALGRSTGMWGFRNGQHHQIRRPHGSRPLQNSQGVCRFRTSLIQAADSCRRVLLDRFSCSEHSRIVVFAEPGTRSGFYRRPITPAHKDHAPGTPILRHGGLCFFERNKKSALGLGSLTHSRRFAQCAPTHRETTQDGVTS